MQGSRRRVAASRISPKVRISTPSTVRRCDRPHRLPSFAAVAAVTDVLALGLIRGHVQAHLAVARVAEQPSSSTPTSLLVRTSWGTRPSCRSASPRNGCRSPAEDAAIRRYRLREVCDSYMRMPSETKASVSSPTDDLQQRAENDVRSRLGIVFAEVEPSQPGAVLARISALGLLLRHWAGERPLRGGRRYRRSSFPAAGVSQTPASTDCCSCRKAGPSGDPSRCRTVHRSRCAPLATSRSTPLCSSRPASPTAQASLRPGGRCRIVRRAAGSPSVPPRRQGGIGVDVLIVTTCDSGYGNRLGVG